jgi:endonuclease/exonuclease/phosphatase family metal-dependent hydrolase
MLRKVAGSFFLTGYIITLLLYLATSLATHLNPASYWYVGFAGLIFPYMLLAVLILTIAALFIRARYAFFGALALFFSYQNIDNLFSFRGVGKEFVVKKAAGNVRIMTWNVRRFTPYYAKYFDPENNNLKAIVEEVEKYDPDIVCFQEFYTSPKVKRRNLELFQKLGYPYFAFAMREDPFLASYEGTIIFSRFPILRSYIYDLPKKVSTGAEDPVAADIKVNDDTIRVATFHMQSYGFLNREYQDLYKIKKQSDTGLKASRNIVWKMRYAFTLRGIQADIIKKEISKSPYPVILCGDLNDVPSSYAYVTTRGTMKDAFLEKGVGLGKTFISGRSQFLTWLPTLRIDYLFLDPGMEVVQFRHVTRQLSDHRGLISDIELPEK